MKIRFWGTRGTRPAPARRTLRYGGNTTCVEIRGKENELLIIDAGSGFAELGESMRGNGPIHAHILVTHTHWDHIQGFPFFAPLFIPGTHLTMLGPAGSIKSLQGAFADQMDPAYWPGPQIGQLPAEIEFIELQAGEVLEVGGLKVTPHLLNHPIATFGYRIDENGRSFAFATDNELLGFEAKRGDSEFSQLESMAQEALVDWCGGVDLLVHDAQYSTEEYAKHVGWGHSTFESALNLAERAEARELGFFHHDPAHSDVEIDELVEQALEKHAWPKRDAMEVFPAAEDQELTL